MTAAAPSLRATIHLVQQTTVTFDAAALWPIRGVSARFGSDLSSFAQEITRRLHTDGYIGFAAGPDSITVIPLSAVKRIDFSIAPGSADRE